MERNMTVMRKENEALYSKIEEMNRATSDKFEHLKVVEIR